MIHNIVTPSVGESITEVSILRWAKQNGQLVKTGDLLLELESDKATVEIVAEHPGVLNIVKNAGERIPIGIVIATIDDSAKPTSADVTQKVIPPTSSGDSNTVLSPAVKKIVTEKGIDVSQISGTGKDGRVTKGDLTLTAAVAKPAVSQPAAPTQVDRPGDRRVQMSLLRSRIAERLVQAQHTAAILTTFNEVDMSGVMGLRNKHKDPFKAKHGVPLSFMSFFTRASVEALKTVPEVNASIDGKDMIYHDYFDIGIAVGSERGLVVPVMRNVEKMGFVDIEKRIGELAAKARDGKLSMADLTGGTFTISNGGTYGSLLSTPILNPPQSGILGMHKIEERPIAISGKVEIRPMMYLALSYDHRIIDGKGAVTFLVNLKGFLEQPEKLGLEY